KEFIASLPRRPGVYRMFGAARELLYVGKARSLKDRVGTYFAAGNVHPKVQALTAQIDAIEVTVTNSETEALLLEYNLIKAHKPQPAVPAAPDRPLLGAVRRAHHARGLRPGHGGGGQGARGPQR